jgi:hypothetical protein
MSQNDCVAPISYCATAYVITAVQPGQFSLELSDLTGLRKQDSQTSGRFWPAAARSTVRRGGEGRDSGAARADPGDCVDVQSSFRCRL